ncbi:MAG TPA: SRPBCC domain-containing protein [Steroidobacteraceae bacterium]|jgi:uncharacterized protein YndB with AHSA1/START domain
MTDRDTPAQAAAAATLRTALAPRGERLTLERCYRARLPCVWVLWTSPAGLESWWGPRGFSIHVEHLDLRSGGEWRYVLAASTPAAVRLMRRTGLPRTLRVCATYTEVLRPRRLRYTQRVDFIPGVRPYESAVLLELHATADEVLMAVTFDAVRAAPWAGRARHGWDSQLGRLARRLAPRAAQNACETPTK